MEKGSLKRPAVLLAAAWLLAGPAGGAVWWEVRLDVSVEGAYTVRGGGAALAGNFSCRSRWEGRLEQDGDDFLLVHLKTEVLEWRLRERSGPAGSDNVLEAPAGVQPDLAVNYVLKDGREVEFVFDLDGVTIPLHASPISLPLELPRVPGRAPGQDYGDFVRRGTSRVAIPETDLLGRSPERRFSWSWRREKRLMKGPAVLDAIQSHTAEVRVSVTAR
ncbi:MAG TPA: hypothetical protein P5119_01415 [Candidatus Aminicenantes bacterium]|nr:hypothetical protein [Candidatus Aminicenantes bacterium]HRY63983.1 hypothetical protein [Candidatus Aminicenantes bacterium]HRZ70896.1 hypothetical protein [Candidatus Aminicenantes bacterium]